MSARNARKIGIVVGIAGALLLGVFATSAWQSSSPTIVRGNAPGEWRYWGADAWSTRYSPLDQINASNFNSLQVAWQWNAGALGGEEGSEYFRTTPLYANGRILTVAGGHRTAVALN